MFDGDKVAEEHIRTALVSSPAVVVEVGLNSETAEPQVYESGAPQDGLAPVDAATGYPPPHVVYYNQGGGSNALQSQTDDPEEALVWYEGLWTVLVVGPAGDEPRLERAKLAVLEALQGTGGTVPSGEGYISVCDLQRSVWLAKQVVEGFEWLRRGYTFRIFAQPPI